MTHFKRLGKALYHSLCGLKDTFKTEAAFRLEVFLSAFLIPLGWYLGTNRMEKILLVSSWFLVLIVEILNSAIEATVDLASPERQALARKAKDAAACAVLFTLIYTVFIWASLLL